MNGSDVVMPNDALRALLTQVDKLGVNYPRPQGTGMDPRV